MKRYDADLGRSVDEARQSAWAAAVLSARVSGRASRAAREGGHLRPGGGDPRPTARRAGGRHGARRAPRGAAGHGAMAARDLGVGSMFASRRLLGVGPARSARARRSAIRSPGPRRSETNTLAGPTPRMEDPAPLGALSVFTIGRRHPLAIASIVP